MPIECKLLERQPYAFEECPECKEPFPDFMRGQIQRGKRWFFIGPKRPYCAVICHGCKNIIGWEAPEPLAPPGEAK